MEIKISQMSDLPVVITKKIEAHEVMNNMCSNLFSIILKANPNPYPLIYLQGISMKDRAMIKKVK